MESCEQKICSPRNGELKSRESVDEDDDDERGSSSVTHPLNSNASPHPLRPPDDALANGEAMDAPSVGVAVDGQTKENGSLSRVFSTSRQTTLNSRRRVDKDVNDDDTDSDRSPERSKDSPRSSSKKGSKKKSKRRSKDRSKRTSEDLSKERLVEQVSVLKRRADELQRRLDDANGEIESLRAVVREHAARGIREKIDVAIQCHVVVPEGHGWMQETEEAVSISDSIRDAASKVQQSHLMEELEQRGFVYEATSGFYYDPSSGYYYDAQRQLYYDGNSKTYYSYNRETGSYTAYAAVEKDEEEDMGSGGKRRKKEREPLDPEAEETLRREKEKLLAGIFSLKNCREVREKEERDKKDREAERRKEREEERDRRKEREKEREKRKKITEEERRATKSKWDSESDDERGGRGEVEEGEISGSSRSSSSSSDSETSKRRRKRRRRSRSRRRRSDDDEDEWVERKIKRDRGRRRDDDDDSPRRRRRRRSSSKSSYDDDDDDRRNDALGRRRRNRRRNRRPGKRDRFPGDDKCDHFPPCIRVIVVESTSLDLGSLFVVTKDGAAIGSASDSAIRIQEDDIAPLQATVSYDMDQRQYFITQRSDVTRDVLVNDDAISSTASGATSVTLAGYARTLRHDDELIVGATRLLCHIHEGTETCDDCEPGQVMAKLNAGKDQNEEFSIPANMSKQEWMRSEMKNLKRKFGLEKAEFEGPPQIPGEENYEDRAEQRRKTKGSHHSSHKTTTAKGTSVKKALASTNKGHQLLSKMGWKEGMGLGKEDQGIVEPIQVGVRSSAAGLGSALNITKDMDAPEVTTKERSVMKTKERFAKILAEEENNS